MHHFILKIKMITFAFAGFFYCRAGLYSLQTFVKNFDSIAAYFFNIIQCCFFPQTKQIIIVDKRSILFTDCVNLDQICGTGF